MAKPQVIDYESVILVSRRVTGNTRGARNTAPLCAGAYAFSGFRGSVAADPAGPALPKSGRRFLSDRTLPRLQVIGFAFEGPFHCQA